MSYLHYQWSIWAQSTECWKRRRVGEREREKEVKSGKFKVRLTG